MHRTNQALLAVWAVIAAFVGYLAVGLVWSRHDVEERTRAQALSYVRLVEQHAAAAFERSDLALQGIIDRLRPDDLRVGARLPDKRRIEIEALLLDHQVRTKGISGMHLSETGGDVIAHSLGRLDGVNTSDRAYFLALEQHPGVRVVVSEAVFGRVTQKWGVIVARRIDLPDGSFSGMAGALLDLRANFADFYATLPLGRDAAVSLRDAENRLLVRYPILEAKLGKEVAPAGPIHDRLRARETEGVLVVPSAMDGIERVFAFRRLANFPVYAAVGLSLEQALIPWRGERDAAVFGGLLVVAAGVFITLILRRNQRVERELARESERNRVLLRTASDGIHILDVNGNVLDVNDAFCRMLGYTRDDMLGMNVTRWDAGDWPDGVIEELPKLRVNTITFETRHRRRDGSIIDVEVCSVGVEFEGESMLFASARDITERKRIQETIQHQAHHDALTGVPNRVLFYDRLSQAITLARRERYELALLYLDLDKFKDVNDALGHAAGDELLKIIATRIRQSLRESDTVARMGGDEFTVILPRIANREDAAEVAVKIIDAVCVPCRLGNSTQAAQEVVVEASVGLAIFPDDGDDADSLVEAADKVMYRAKREGNRYCFRQSEQSRASAPEISVRPRFD